MTTGLARRSHGPHEGVRVDFADRLLDRFDTGGRLYRGAVGGVVVAVAIAALWSVQWGVRATNEWRYLHDTSASFSPSVPDDQRLAAGYHACNWLRAQDAWFVRRPDGGIWRAVRLFRQTSPSNVPNERIPQAAWTDLCRSDAEEKLSLPGYIGVSPD